VGTLTYWNPLGLSRPVTGLLYIYLITIYHNFIDFNILVYVNVNGMQSLYKLGQDVRVPGF